jgi:septum formation protein
VSAKIVLASGSPRRIELMRAAGLDFEFVPSGIDERPPERLGPLRHVRWAARAKAEAVARRRPDAVIVGADTEVVLAGRIFGKPASPRQAQEFLRALSGRTHQVYTAVQVIAPGRACSGVSRTHVTMRELSGRTIAAYVRTGEAQDKAGAYAIQGEGRRLVRSIQGPHDNVVGMPIRLLSRLLSECGVPVTAKSPDGLQHDVTAQTRRLPRRPTVGAARR